MNSRNNSYRGFGFYLVLILIVVGVWYFLDGNTTTNSYTRAAFEKDIQSGDVTAIDIGECSGGELDHDTASISDHIRGNVYFLHDHDQSGSGKRGRRQQQDDEFW